jgi:hypothetical protein
MSDRIRRLTRRQAGNAEVVAGDQSVRVVRAQSPFAVTKRAAE